MFYLKSLLILLGIISSLSIQANTALEQVGQISLPNKTYKVDGQYLYAACKNFEVFDLVDPLKPNLIASLPLTQTDTDTEFCVSNISISNGYAYLTGYGGHMDIINISSPNSPKKLGSYGNSMYSSYFTIEKNHAYSNGNGFSIFDLTDPTHPSLVKNKIFSDDSSSFSYKVSGDLLIVRKVSAVINNDSSSITDKLLIFSLKNPTQIEQISSIVINERTEKGYYHIGYFPNDVFEVDGQYIYVKFLSDLITIDISNPLNPQKVAKYTVENTVAGEQFARDKIIINGRTLYFLCNTCYTDNNPQNLRYKLLSFDISTPTQLLLISSYIVDNDLNSGSYTDGFVYKQNIYIQRRNQQSIILDISDLSKIKEVGQLFDGDTTLVSVLVKGNYAYANRANGDIFVADITNPNNPIIVYMAKLNIPAPYFYGFGSRYPSYLFKDNRVESNYIYSCNKLGLYIIDVSTTLQPKKVGEYLLPSPGICNRVIISGNYAYLISTETPSKITILDISNPVLPTKISEYQTGEQQVTNIALKDNILCAATNKEKLLIIDIGNLNALQEIAVYEAPSNITSIVLTGQYAYLMLNNNTLHIIDLSTPNAPKLATNYNSNNWSSAGYYNSDLQMILGSSTTLFFTDNHGLFKLDISNPTQPKQIAQAMPFSATYNMMSMSNQLAAVGSYVYGLASGGVKIFKSVEIETIKINGLSNGACELNLGAKMLNADDGTGKNAGDFYLQWKETGRESTTSGDAVIAGYFYAPSEKVTWGSDANPEVYAKLWFSVNGILNVNFFHVGVFDVQLASSYGVEMPQLNGGSTLDHNKITIGRKEWRYSRHDYTNWRSCGANNAAISSLKVEEVPRQTLKEMAASNPKFTTSVFKSPSTSAAKITGQTGSCELLIDAKMLNATSNGKPYGNLKLQWKEISRSTTSGGDTVIAGYFYGSPNEVSWGSTTNPEAYVKIWYARNGMLNVNFFHVGVFDIELTSSYKGSVPDGIDGLLNDDNNFIKIWSDANRYSRHDYNNWKLCN